MYAAASSKGLEEAAHQVATADGRERADEELVGHHGAEGDPGEMIPVKRLELLSEAGVGEGHKIINNRCWYRGGSPG